MVEERLVSVIIVSWNSEKWLEKCISSLYQQYYKAIEIILVDNGSSDNSVNLVKSQFPEVIITNNQVNLGFAQGNNLGVQNCKGEFIFLLNPDAWVEVDTIVNLVKTLESDPMIGLVGPKILHPDGSVQETGLKIDLFGFPVPLKPCNVVQCEHLFYVSGCAMLMRRSLYLALEGFAAVMFMFHEDIDLCWRIHLIGKKIVLNQAAIVNHYSGGSIEGGSIKPNSEYRSSLQRIYLRERNTLFTLISNYQLVTLTLLLPFYFILGAAESILLFILGKREISKQYLRAYAWNLKYLRTTWYRHKKIQKQRIISDFEIFPFLHLGLGKLLSFKQVGIPKISRATK